MPTKKDTIAAIATPPGTSGIGVIRVSGLSSKNIFKALTGTKPKNRSAQYVSFKSSENEVLDRGISLFFQGPASYTGEDTMECFIHGNRMLLDMLLSEIFSLGARPALPGEFTERAFLNGKIDLIQAEAVADLINSSSKSAAKSALRSLDGSFSRRVLELKEKIVGTKAMIEASLDFPDEEDIKIYTAPAYENIKDCLVILDNLLGKACKGSVLSQTPLVVIVGAPNAGKSTLMNYISGVDSAIVSKTPGTTRDVIREKILLKDHLITLTDTAGMHNTKNLIEKDGIERANKEIRRADLVLYVIDVAMTERDIRKELNENLPADTRYLLVKNKIDLVKNITQKEVINDNEFNISAKTGEGIEKLLDKISSVFNFTTEEDVIFARRRHVDALSLLKECLDEALLCIERKQGLELVAEPLRQGLILLDEVIGKTTTDDILDNIFSRFCIGK